MLIGILLVVFLILQVLDFYTTYKILENGGKELNPVVAKLINKLGYYGLALIKLLGIIPIFVTYAVLPTLYMFWLLLIVDIFYSIVIINNWRNLK